MRINFNYKEDFDTSEVYNIIEREELTINCSKKELNNAIKESVIVTFICSIQGTLDNMHLDSNIVDDLRNKGFLK